MSEHGPSGLRSWARNWLPPALLRLAQRIPGAASRYEGPFGSWLEATQHSAGYDDAAILERVRDSTHWALGALDRYEQDSVRVVGPCPPSHALEAILLGMNLTADNPIVWDIGGALGSHYLRWRSWLQAAGLAHWRVIEQDHFVAAGEALFEARPEPLSFHRSMRELTADVPAAVLLSSVLQYLPAEEDPLEAICRAGARAIVIDRTPFSADQREHHLVQRTPAKIYKASYPLRTISSARVATILEPDYRLLHRFDTSDGAISLRGVSATYQGQIWLRN